MEKEIVGYVYILENPSFEEYVKIGYADDVEQRVKELNRSEAVPFGFRIYATYKVNHRLDDKKVHEIFDRLNPNLRAKDDIDGKIRTREFFAIPKDEAYNVLRAMAEIHNCPENLKLHKPTKTEKEDEKMAAVIRQKAPNKDFYSMELQDGMEIFLIKKPELKAVICGANKVTFNGSEPMTITACSDMLFQKFNLGIPHVGGFEYFAYDNPKETLYARYNRIIKGNSK